MTFRTATSRLSCPPARCIPRWLSHSSPGVLRRGVAPGGDSHLIHILNAGDTRRQLGGDGVLLRAMKKKSRRLRFTRVAVADSPPA